MKLARNIASAALTFFFASGIVAACNSANQARAECALAAVEQLPLDDPDQISVGDVRGVVTRLKACQQGDAGQ